MLEKPDTTVHDLAAKALNEVRHRSRFGTVSTNQIANLAVKHQLVAWSHMESTLAGMVDATK